MPSSTLPYAANMVTGLVVGAGGIVTPILEMLIPGFKKSARYHIDDNTFKADQWEYERIGIRFGRSVLDPAIQSRM